MLIDQKKFHQISSPGTSAFGKQEPHGLQIMTIYSQKPEWEPYQLPTLPGTLSAKFTQSFAHPSFSLINIPDLLLFNLSVGQPKLTTLAHQDFSITLQLTASQPPAE